MAYLTAPEFKGRTLAPANLIEEVESRSPNWLTEQLALFSGLIDARLRKRYAAPFAQPYPEIVQLWLLQLVTPRIYLKAGTNATDQQYQELRDEATHADSQIREAADADKGLFDLPLRADTTAAGIARGKPKGYTETSPYKWRDEQALLGREEDGGL